MSKKQNQPQSEEQKRSHQDLLLQKKKMIAESDRHLKQITKLTYQMDEVSDNTAVQLKGQTDQLKRIQNIGNDIGKQMKKADKHSKQMTSFWYYLKQKVKGLVVNQTSDEPSKQHQKVNKIKQPQAKTSLSQNNNYQSEPILDQIDEDNYEEKQNQQLDQISKQLKKLKLKAKGIGNQIDTQSEIIGRIDKKMDQNSANIQKVDKRIKKHFF